MERSGERKYYLDMVAAVRSKLADLPEGSHIRSALSNSGLEEISRQVEDDDLDNLKWAYWPPLFIFLLNHPIRVNYNANASCSLSHREIARLEESLENPPDWCHQ
jgi:hypothetical protein